MNKDFIQVSIPMTGEEEAAAVREVILSGRFVSGQKVREFEQGFADYCGSAHGCAVNSGTAALHLALAALGVGPGDEVIVPPLTFMSTVTAVLHQNATPVFADIDPDSFCLDPAAVERAITPRTKAAIPVHLFGNCADMDGFLDLAERHGLKIIEDCAQAHGSEHRGRRVGSMGHAGAFSFYATKHMTTGEGGLITTGDADLAETCRKLRSHGMSGRDRHDLLGYNYRMNEMAAAMGLVQLAKLEQYNTARIDNSLYLLDALARHTDKWFRVPKFADHVRHTFFWAPLVIPRETGLDPAEVVARLRERGMEVRFRYAEPLYRQPVLKAFTNGNTQDYGSLLLPVVEETAGRVIGLPNHPGLTRHDLDRVLETLVELY